METYLNRTKPDILNFKEMRKKITTCLWILFVAIGSLHAQIAINPNGDLPNPSAMLDVNSSNKGVLIPRMTLVEMNAIENPAEGLMIYCTDCNVNGGLVTHFGESWSIMDRNVTKNGLMEIPPLNQNYGGSSNESVYDMALTSDYGYIVAGTSSSSNGDVGGNNGGRDYWIVKLTSSGTIDWETNLGGSDDDIPRSIQQTFDNGYIVAGSSYSSDGDVGGNNGGEDYWIVKLTSTGSIDWETNLGGSFDDRANSIQQTLDGGYIVAGYSESSDGDVGSNNGDADYWIVKLSMTGTIEWEKNLGGDLLDWAYSVMQTLDGGFIVAGDSESSDGDVGGNYGSYDYWIVKLTSIGEIDWETNLGGSNNDEYPVIQQTIEGGYIISGESYSDDGDVSGNNGDYDYWIVKLTSIGEIDWETNLGGSRDEEYPIIQQTIDGGYIIAGESQSDDGDVGGNNRYYDYWIVKLTPSGSIEWETNLGGNEDDWANSIQQTDDGGYIVAGNSKSDDGDVPGNYGGSDFWIIKLDGDGKIQQ